MACDVAQNLSLCKKKILGVWRRILTGVGFRAFNFCDRGRCSVHGERGLTDKNAFPPSRKKLAASSRREREEEAARGWRGLPPFAEPDPDAHAHEEERRGAVEVNRRDEGGDGLAHGHAD